MSDANETRGEISLELGGTDYVLRPSYQAIQAIEKKLGRGLIALTQDCAQGLLSLSELAVIASECIRAHGRAIDDKMATSVHPDKIAELIVDCEGGITACAGRINFLLMLAATGGYTASGELKAAKEAESVAIA